MNLASALLNRAKFNNAEDVYRRNLDARRRKLGPGHADTLKAAMNLASQRPQKPG